MHSVDLVIINGLLHRLDDHEALTALKLAHASLAPSSRLVCLEACFLISQAQLNRWVLKQDRGENVRTELEWKTLIAKVFEKSESYIRTGLLRIPIHLSSLRRIASRLCIHCTVHRSSRP
jgi:hypothetical protein